MNAQSILLIVLLAAAPAVPVAAELRRETVKAWDGYIRTVEMRLKDRAASGHFLWTGEERDRSRLRQGDVLVSPVYGSSPQAVQYGLIHHWIGAIFIPHATIDDVACVMRDYARYSQFYKPVVIDARLLGRTPEQDKFTMLWVHKALFAGAALTADYESRFYRLNENRMLSIAYTTRVQEIQDYGRAGAYRLPPGTGSGYIWQLYSIARYEARDGGVYAELEAIALSRDIPASIRWAVKPVIDRLSRRSLETSLEQTRDAVAMERLRAVAQIHTTE